jgi:hypothetical protein
MEGVDQKSKLMSDFILNCCGMARVLLISWRKSPNDRRSFHFHDTSVTIKMLLLKHMPCKTIVKQIIALTAFEIAS